MEIKVKKNQKIVYSVTFKHKEKDLRMSFLITKSNQKRSIDDKFVVSDDIYHLYRVDSSCNRKLHILTSSIYEICINAISYILNCN